MSLFNLDLPQYAMFAVALIFVLGLIFLLTWILRRVSGINGGQAPFSRRDRRLKVVESAAIGNRHRLILVSRDHTEHLLLVGGTTDLVVERNISRNVSPAATPSQTSFQSEASKHIEPRFSGQNQSLAGSDEETDAGSDIRPGPRPGEG